MTLLTPNAPPTLSRAFYAALVSDFLNDPLDSIVGRLSARHVALFPSAERDQMNAWSREIEILKATFRDLGPACWGWSILLEFPLFRLGKRLDAIVLAPSLVLVVEFKIGATRYESADILQTEGYALALRDFHEVSRARTIVPILCAENAPDRGIRVDIVEGVARIIEANHTSLGHALRAVGPDVTGFSEPEGWFEFDNSAYRPTPPIIEAAQALYSGHEIDDIGRGDATDDELRSAAEALDELVADTETSARKTVCFVTGAPGAGKTLLGLNLALTNRDGQRPAALLSGNPPLVHVLTEALTEDAAKRTTASKAEARRQAKTAIQNLLGYLKEHTDGAVPPENVIIFDEAQRAWDAEVGQKLMGRPQSEPDLFLSILDRLDWACLVCLVGPGQEINRGEGGLALWGEALTGAADLGRPWTIVAAPDAINGGRAVTGAGLRSSLNSRLDFREERRLHLANSMRAYRNELHGAWVAALLESDIEAARRTADEMAGPPALLTRDLEVAKAWLRRYRRGGRSVGLLASSGAVRLVAEGLPPTLRSNELGPIGHWFLKPWTDFRSGGALEVPLSEFGCQGLEVDQAALCWGGDLIWNNGAWLPRTMRAPKWQVVRDEERKRFRLNGYRVLLTRARAGSIIYVPTGNADDPTRSPKELDGVAATLTRAGCEEIWCVENQEQGEAAAQAYEMK